MNKIEIVEHADGTCDFRIKDAGNNEILAFSNQGYENKNDCLATAHSVTTDPVEGIITFAQGEL